MTKASGNNGVVKAINIDPTAVIYLRVSTSEQARRGGQVEGFSLPIQRERTRAKASEELSAVVVEEFLVLEQAFVRTGWPVLLV
jgi:site-specific DNA recombinase